MRDMTIQQAVRFWSDIIGDEKSGYVAWAMQSDDPEKRELRHGDVMAFVETLQRHGVLPADRLSDIQANIAASFPDVGHVVRKPQDTSAKKAL